MPDIMDRHNPPLKPYTDINDKKYNRRNSNLAKGLAIAITLITARYAAQASTPLISRNLECTIVLIQDGNSGHVALI